jgi:hypothetical protein
LQARVVDRWLTNVYIGGAQELGVVVLTLAFQPGDEVEQVSTRGKRVQEIVGAGGPSWQDKVNAANEI